MKETDRGIGPFLSNDIDSGGGLVFPEAPHIEVLKPITAQMLIDANTTPEARENRQRFTVSKKVIDWECIDARNVRLLATETRYFNTIANGGEPEKLKNAVNDPNTLFALVVAHGPDCGGRNAKKQQLTNGIYTAEADGLSRYISDEVEHPSVLFAGVQARRLSMLTNKEVAAMVRNHEDGSLRVLGIFNREDGKPSSNYPDEVFDQDPTMLDPTADVDIAYLTDDQLTDQIRDYLVRHEEKRKELLDGNPDVLQHLKDHNPRIIKFSTDFRAAEVIIPALATPGNIVRLTAARERRRMVNGQKRTYLDPRELELVREQAEYVITHAVKNRGKETGSFRDTDTFLILTPDYNLSQDFALSLAHNEFMHPWLADERNKLLLVQDNQGEFTCASEVKIEINNGRVVGMREVEYAIPQLAA